MSVTFSNLKSSEEPQAPVQPQPAAEVMRGPEVSASPSDPAMLRKLYAAMLQTRMVEERAQELAHAHKLKSPLAISPGLEASTIGSLIELRAGDAVASHLGYAPRMFAGQPLGLYFAELYAVRAEYFAFAPRAANTAIHVLPTTSTVAAQLNAAAACALAIKKSQRPNVVLVHLPNAADALGYWHEAATLASAERLPMVLVGIDGSMNPGSFGSSDIRERASSYGIPGITVDGGDVVGMWRVTQESIYRARGGAGPTLIDSQVVAAANSKTHPGEYDPLARMQRYLKKRNVWDESWSNELAQKFAAEIAEAQAFFPRAGETQ